MPKRPQDGLFELPPESGAEPFEQEDLRARTNFQSRAPRSGADFKTMALGHLRQAGAEIVRGDHEIDGFPVDAVVRGPNGREFLVLARGTPADQKQSGLRRTDTVEKVGYMAMQLVRRQPRPILLLTSDLPRGNTKAGIYLAALSSDVWDVIAYRGDLRGFRRLQEHLAGPVARDLPAAPWRSYTAKPAPELFDSLVSTDNPSATPQADLGTESRERPRHDASGTDD